MTMSIRGSSSKKKAGQSRTTRSTSAHTSTRGVPSPTSTRGVPAPMASRGLEVLTRHNEVIEPMEYGRITRDASDGSDAAYIDARSNDLLYLETSGKRYPVHNNTGWPDQNAIGKIGWVSDTYPADTDEAGRHAHYTTIPPRYSEGELELATTLQLLGIC